jgi:acetyl/propionyl-CoA carboxylase alpha subunit/acetyl-CoA carboxylase carboxyltransferase component
MLRDIRRIAVINRGEPAMRFIRGIRDYNRSHQTRIRSVVFFTAPDRRARFVQEADEAFDLGPPTFTDPQDGQRRSAYLDMARLEKSLTLSGVDAVWPGWGFASERPELVGLCHRLGLVFIGPGSASMRRLGDKISAKLLAGELGIPVIPWGGGPAPTMEAARAQANNLSYPVVIKATAGEGGRGIRKVNSEAELAAAFEAASGEALRFFGNPVVFVERWLEGVRHVEVQLLADQHGTTWAVGTRDCSIQRRRQKVLEEAPALIPPEIEREMGEAAVRLCRAASYTNAGTVELLYDPHTKRYAFMEVNVRIQVEHAVTELTTGLDLIQLQLHIARGGKLEGAPPVTSGHAIEVRLNAEDPEEGFAASPGRVELLHVPTRPNLRLDNGVAEGDEIPAEFDSMFGKLISFGPSRTDALTSLTRALEESTIVLDRGTSNRSFLLHLLESEDVRENRLDVDWLDRLTESGRHVSDRFGEIALLQAAIDVYDREFAGELESFFDSAMRMRLVVRAEAGRVVELRYRGHFYRFRVFRHSSQHYRIEADGVRTDVGIDRIGSFEQWITVAGSRLRVVAVVSGLTHLVEVGGSLHRISRDDRSIIRASAPSVVTTIDVGVGESVAAGQRLALLEAMKMEMPVLAPFAGTVRELMVLNNAQVGPGAPLIRVEPGEEGGGTPRQRVSFSTPGRASPTPYDAVAATNHVLAELRNLVLGSDFHPDDARRFVTEYSGLCRLIAPGDEGVYRGEEEILNVFADISSLFRRKAAPEYPEDVERMSSGEYFVTYLRTISSHGASLPASFQEKLRRALSHYGSDSLEPTPALRARLLWIYKSRQRVEQQVPAIVAILERRLAHANVLAPRAGQEFLATLDRLITASENRFPVLHDIARAVRYRYFEQTFFEQARSAVFREMEAHLAHLLDRPDVPDRNERVRALVECPYPLMKLFQDRADRSSPQLRLLMLEVMTRRYYRMHNLEDFRTFEIDGRWYASAVYGHADARTFLVAGSTEATDLAGTLASVRPVVAAAPEGLQVVIDVHAWSSAPPPDIDALGEVLRNMINATDFPRPVQRVVVAAAGPGGGMEVETTQHFTFDREQDGFIEEKTYRGLHPMLSERLQLWRLRNFSIERLPSAEDVFMFHCVALENKKDERFFVLAEVRDLTPVRDKAGRIVQLPYLERMLQEALAAIRDAQMRRAPEGRLYWNRVFLYLWPPLDLQADEPHGIARRLARQSEGYGLEKVVLRAMMRDRETGMLKDTVLSISNPTGRGIVIRAAPPSDQPMRPLAEYEQKVVRLRQRGLPYPYEVIRSFTQSTESIDAAFPPGDFTEYDFDENGRLAPVQRPYGKNSANIVVGVIRNRTPKYPEGMSRVILLGDPSKEMGSLAEPECRLILGALDLAETMQVPLEWFALSAGAKISMESGTENMDWIARVLRRLIEFTQAGGEVNIIVTGINVGAQPYWNAEATMLMHTRGILVMMRESAMVLTGKTALDYSGSVSAEDNLGIGGYESVMGPNGQAQYWAADLAEACQLLIRHYDHTYILPGERSPRRAVTSDPAARDVRLFPHGDDGDEFRLVGDVFSSEMNAERKKPFEIRRVMLAVTDQDHLPLERWAGMSDAEIAVVWDAHIGGYPVCLLGFESKPLPRVGFVATDGPEQWTSGTLFPMSSRKVARAINACSNNRPLVILANLSGFDGSPESMRHRQLEFGAEIGRAIVNFKGPIVFCVVSRYHGGAFVVFSKVLNENMEAAALEGTYASVIGGAPAAAVVFARDVDGRTRKDPRLLALEKEIAAAEPAERRKLQSQLAELKNVARSEKLGEVADEFDRVHTVQRALAVGSLDRIIPAAELRPYVISAIERRLQLQADRDDSQAGSRWN